MGRHAWKSFDRVREEHIKTKNRLSERRDKLLREAESLADEIGILDALIAAINTIPPESRAFKDKHDERGAFIAGEYAKGTKLVSIRSRVNATDGWGYLGTDAAVLNAMDSYHRNRLHTDPPRRK